MNAKLCAPLQMVSPEKYEVKGSIQEAAIILTSGAEPKMQVTITLTSPIIREENARDGGWESCRPTSFFSPIYERNLAFFFFYYLFYYFYFVRN